MFDVIKMSVLVSVMWSCLAFSVQCITLKMVRIVNFDNMLDERYVVTDHVGLPHRGACASFCHKDVLCVAITYNILNGRCLLHSVHFYNMNFGESQQGWRYLKLFTDECPREYVYNRVAKLCFLHDLRGGNWRKCERLCNERNSSLLIIDTPEKQTELERQSNCSKVYNSKNYFLGGYKDNRTWRWIGGREITMTFWYSPNVSLHDGNLALFRNKGYKWEVLRNRRHFICEKANVLF